MPALHAQDGPPEVGASCIVGLQPELLKAVDDARSDNDGEFTRLFQASHELVHRAQQEARHRVVKEDTVGEGEQRIIRERCIVILPGDQQVRTLQVVERLTCSGVGKL